MTDALAPLSPEQLKAHVVAELEASARINPATTGALVAVVNRDHIQIAVATRLDRWTVELQGTYPWGGDPRLEVNVRTTW